MSKTREIRIGAETSFFVDAGRPTLTELCGMPAAGPGVASASTVGMALIRIDGRRYEYVGLFPVSAEELAGGFVCRWKLGGTDIFLDAHWRVCPRTGVLSRCDTLENAGKDAATLSMCLARFAFPRGRYEIYSQSCRWCRENQGVWQRLAAGRLELRNVSGRTTEGCAPYLAVRPAGGGRGIALHLLPQGNWLIRVSAETLGGDLPYLVLEAGLACENLARRLQPGERLELPELLVQPLPENREPHFAAPALHEYLQTRFFADARPEAPVVYNTWFHEFEILDVPRLRSQLAAAKEAGCEVFTVDAGWYGESGSNWSAQVGNWREKTGAAFDGRMREFADEVRASGLGFGLWMEPERFGPAAPLRGEHPDWFVEIGNGMARLDLARPEPYAWLRAEIGRLIETYGLAWMKLDFNSALDPDASGGELYDYYLALYKLLDEIRRTYPGTFFEGCSSGAMRCDINTLRHFDAHFLSDTVNPLDMLRITQGAWLRLPPGRVARWAVVRSAGRAVPQYGRPAAESAPAVLTPAGALWEPAETTDLKFALLAALPGMFGLSGDIAGLAREQRELLRQAVVFYKRWRRFITAAAGRLLAPPAALEERRGWAAFQLSGSGARNALVFVYRLGACGAPPRLAPEALEPDSRYAVLQGFEASDAGVAFSGSELMSRGLPLPPELTSPGSGFENRAEVFCLERIV